MTRLIILNDPKEIPMSSKWSSVKKSNKVGKLVNEKGIKVGTYYAGRRYRIIKEERCNFSCRKRVQRWAIGAFLVLFTFPFGLCSRSIRKLFTKSGEKRCFVVLDEDTRFKIEDKKIVYLNPEIIFGGAETKDEKQLNFALIQAQGEKKLVPVIGDSMYVNKFTTYEGSPLDVILALAQHKDWSFYTVSRHYGSPFKHFLDLQKEDIIKEEELFKFILDKDENGTPRFCTLNRSSTLEILNLQLENKLSIDLEATTTEGETLFTLWASKGESEVTKKILEIDPTVIKQIEGRKESILVKAVLSGDHENVQLLISSIEKEKVKLSNEEKWIVKAIKGDSTFLKEDFEKLEEDLKNKIYYTANAFLNEELVQKLKNFGMHEAPFFHSDLDIFAYNMNIVDAKSAMKNFLVNLKKNGLLLTEKEFIQLGESKYISKGEQINRIQGRNFVENTAKKLGLKYIKVPKKTIVTKKGNSSLNLTLSRNLQIVPEGEDSQLTVYAEKIKHVERKLSLDEAIEFMIILEKTGYNDFFGNNFIFAEDGIYFIDTEYKDFSPNNPKWGSIETIKNLIEDPQEVQKFMDVFNRRKAEFEKGAEDRNEHTAKFKKLYKDRWKSLVRGYAFRRFEFPLSEI